jgi:hypothetical protein
MQTLRQLLNPLVDKTQTGWFSAPTGLFESNTLDQTFPEFYKNCQDARHLLWVFSISGSDMRLFTKAKLECVQTVIGLISAETQAKFNLPIYEIVDVCLNFIKGYCGSLEMKQTHNKYKDMITEFIHEVIGLNAGVPDLSRKHEAYAMIALCSCLELDSRFMAAQAAASARYNEYDGVKYIALVDMANIVRSIIPADKFHI